MKIILHFFIPLLIVNNFCFGQTENKRSKIDSFTAKMDTATTVYDKIKCDSSNHTGLSHDKVRNQWLCISFKINNTGTEILRIEERSTDQTICEEHYIYYYNKNKLIKVIATKGNEKNLLVNSIFYYENDEPIYEIQYGIELYEKYPIQRAYELLNFVTR